MRWWKRLGEYWEIELRNGDILTLGEWVQVFILRREDPR